MAQVKVYSNDWRRNVCIYMQSRVLFHIDHQGESILWTTVLVQIRTTNDTFLYIYNSYGFINGANTWPGIENFYPSPYLGAELGLKDMQMGGITPRMERIAEGMLQIPSPQISPDATATA